MSLIIFDILTKSIKTHVILNSTIWAKYKHNLKFKTDSILKTVTPYVLNSSLKTMILEY